MSSEDSSSQDSNASAAPQDGKNNRRTLVEPIALSDDDSDEGRGSSAKPSYRGRGFGSGEIYQSIAFISYSPLLTTSSLRISIV